jgi:ketosteroid isomerase-like protein
MYYPDGARLLESRQAEQAKKEVTAFVTAYFELGKSKDITNLSRFFSPSQYFSKFDESPPYTRQDSDEAFMYEQARFANISDYEYKIGDLRIDVIGFVAIATFYLDFKGVFVNDYSFEGSTVGGRSRVTMVLGKFGDEWRIVHHHVSRFEDLKKSS